MKTNLKERIKMLRKAMIDSLKTHSHSRENARRLKQRERANVQDHSQEL